MTILNISPSAAMNYSKEIIKGQYSLDIVIKP